MEYIWLHFQILHSFLQIARTVVHTYKFINNIENKCVHKNVTFFVKMNVTPTQKHHKKDEKNLMVFIKINKSVC